MASKDYSGLKKVELIGIAKRKKASVTATMNKDEIVKAIKKVDKARARAKAKPASKPKAKARPVKKEETKARPVKKVTAAVTAPAKKAKAKARPVKKPQAAMSAPVKKTKAKARPVKKPQAAMSAPVKKTKAKAKPVVSKSTRPAAPGKKKAASAKTSVDKPEKKVSRPAIIKEPAPKPAAKNNRRNDWSIRMAARKFFTAGERDDFPPEEEEAQLPGGYGENQLVALPKDPRSLFVYWEVQADRSEEARGSLGKSWEQVKWTLRVFDVTSLQGVEEAYHNFFDVTVDPEAGKHYLNVEGDGREYIVELGLKDADKRFSSICFSNRVHTPRAGLSPGGEDLPDEEAQKLYALSGGRHPGSVFMEEMASLGVSGFGASEQAPAMRAERDFFLWVNCELTVYGGTAPGSRLILQGQEVNLRPDGTFSAKFHLPEGVQDILVSGTSSDNVDNKEISLSVSRSSRIVR